MNRILISGRIKRKAKLFYTPHGERIWEFPFQIEDGNFEINILYKEKDQRWEFKDLKDEKLIIIGMLFKTRENHYVVDAKNLIFMED